MLRLNKDGCRISGRTRYKNSSDGEWADKGEKPRGTRRTKLELTSDAWDVWGIEATKGGERLGLKLK